jgi:hypothetical protein
MRRFPMAKTNPTVEEAIDHVSRWVHIELDHVKPGPHEEVVLDLALATIRKHIEDLGQERDEAKEALREIEEAVGRGFADIVVANTVLGRIQTIARTFLNQEHPECPRNTSAEEGDTDGGS